MLFILLIVFTFTFSPSLADQTVSICKGVSQSGYFTKKSDLSSNTIAKFSFDMSVSSNANNPTLPNILMIANFSFSDLQPDANNFIFNTLLFSFFGNRHKVITCPSISTQNCIFEFPNGEIIYFFNYYYDGKQSIANGPYLYVNDGTFYDGKTSDVWNPSPNLTCDNYQSSIKDLNFWYFGCCNYFEDIRIPDSNNGTSNNGNCQNFETVTTISDPSTTKPISIITHYLLLPSTNTLQTKIAVLDSPDPAYIYYAYVGYPFVSYINGSSSTQNTSFTLILGNEKQYEILFDYNPSATDAGDGIFKYGGVSLGEIIIRNGIFLKNVNQPYTPGDPCWKKVATVPFTNATYNTSFCCTSFLQQQETTTASLSTLSTTTSSMANNLLDINVYLLFGTLFVEIIFCF